MCKKRFTSVYLNYTKEGKALAYNNTPGVTSPYLFASVQRGGWEV